MRSYRPPSELEPGGTNCLEQAREDAYGRPVGGGLGGGGGGWGGAPAANFFCTELRAAPCSRGTWLAIWCVCRVRSADGRGNIESRILIKRLPDLRAHGALDLGSCLQETGCAVPFRFLEILAKR